MPYVSYNTLTGTLYHKNSPVNKIYNKPPKTTKDHKDTMVRTHSNLLCNRHNRRKIPRAPFFRENSHRCNIFGFFPEWLYLCPDNFIFRSKRTRSAWEWYLRWGDTPLRVFPNRWISRNGMVECPARSSDLAPLDYLWGYSKSKAYLTRPENLSF